MGPKGSVYSIEQKQLGGIIFQAWIQKNGDLREGTVWLHPDGEVSTHGDDEIISVLFSKFRRFLDGVVIKV